MIRSHREFLEYFESISCIRMFIVSMMPDGEGFDGKTGSIVTLTDKQQLSQPQQGQHPTSSPATSSDSMPIYQSLSSTNTITNTNNNANHANVLLALSETQDKPDTPVIDGIYEDHNSNNNTNNNNNTITNGTGYISSGDSDKELLFNPDNIEEEVNLNSPQINTTSSEPLVSHTSVQAGINNTNPINISSTSNNTIKEAVPPATATAYHKTDNNTVNTELWSELRESYNDCVSNLQRFRSSHINIVAEVGVCILGIYCVMCMYYVVYMICCLRLISMCILSFCITSNVYHAHYSS